ncbi:hypothetical protein DFP94_113110 [Fontibacillus phaseoli]|uniref:Carbohydrate binding protein n=1 Tax=Fontibacillus phaseoli TaxID=1416533 RepID=A0A369B3X6_9BACL|nr:hypothetical protein [Fontibacillus phaseoli]RCX16252.1 hypothetical protein DFP94_113110 [Fontibacillus phaseoli]
MLRIAKLAMVALMIWILALLPGGALHADGENVLQNAGFETISSDAPDLWNRDVWLQTEGSSHLGIAQDQAHSGNASAVVENMQPNHAKWVQQAKVNPGRNYLISGWVQVAEMGSGEVGATIFPLGVGGCSRI